MIPKCQLESFYWLLILSSEDSPGRAKPCRWDYINLLPPEGISIL